MGRKRMAETTSNETDKQVDKASNEDSSTHLNYKSLYVDSQKKVEGLMEENFHISQKLEFALGKIEAYEKMMGVMCASKEVVLFPTSSPLKKHAPVAVVGHETPSPKPKKPKKEPKKPKKEPKKPLRTYKKKNAVSFY
ncbi:uncharacterized protein [Henckelia pumila]|uniref:uncharacterized protein n=1 Tax=Henckelia pumila TaxID=405737 RepID=UPI003C6E22BC